MKKAFVRGTVLVVALLMMFSFVGCSKEVDTETHITKNSDVGIVAIKPDNEIDEHESSKSENFVDDSKNKITITSTETLVDNKISEEEIT